MAAKVGYSIDPFNRLVIRHKRARIICDGLFSNDQRNRLAYHLNEPPAWRRIYNLPSQVKFEGKWRLSPDHNLELALTRDKGRLSGERLLLKGEIISVDNNALAFAVTSLDKEGFSHIRIIRLYGCWQADEYNRITFLVKKSFTPDILTLKGIWRINQNQQVVYSYEKKGLKSKERILKNLVFAGFWEIDSEKRLTYILEGSSKSRFDFRIQIESPNLYPKNGAIKYRLGIGIKGQGSYKENVIYLYGAWKLSRLLGLIFQMEYDKGNIHAINFGTDIALSRKDKIIFSLKSRKDEPLGLNIVFSRKFLKEHDAELYLRLRNILNRNSSIEAGLKIPF